ACGSGAEEADLVARATLKKWDPESRDTGANKTARDTALAAMEQYYTSYRGKRGAARFVVRAAYYVALASEIGKSGSARDAWKRTVSSFATYAAEAPKE